MLPILSPQTGWICPKCGKVFAPFVPQCTTCGCEKVPNPKRGEGKTETRTLLTEGAR